MRIALNQPPAHFGSATAKSTFSTVEYGAAKLLHKLAHTDTMKKMAEYASQDSKAVNISGKTIKNLDHVIKKHMPAVLALWISSFYVLNNLKSDIPSERKVPLLINDIITASFATAAGYTIVNGFKAFQFGLEEKLVKSMPLTSFIESASNVAKEAQKTGKTVVKHLDDLLNLAKDKEFTENVLKKLGDAIKSAPKGTDKALIVASVADDVAKEVGTNTHVVKKFVKLTQTHADKINTLKGGIGLMMGLFAFTFVFRYLGPVVATPAADKVNKFLIKHKLIKDPNSKPEDKQTSIPVNASQQTVVASTVLNSDYMTVLNQYFIANKIK